jgi:hypothetical protein
MIKTLSVSDEISNEVATAILTKQKELNIDPKELLNIVFTVHNTLRQLSAEVCGARKDKVDHISCVGN